MRVVAYEAQILCNAIYCLPQEVYTGGEKKLKTKKGKNNFFNRWRVCVIFIETRELMIKFIVVTDNNVNCVSAGTF